MSLSSSSEESEEEFFDALSTQQEAELLEPDYSASFAYTERSGQDLTPTFLQRRPSGEFPGLSVPPGPSSPLKKASTFVRVREVRNAGKFVRSHDKECQEFSGLNCVQELQIGTDVWAMEFSPDGRFLAVGGTDGILHVFEVSPHDTFLAPYKSYLGHKNRILDLAWIGQDIVTVSMDKTAVVWRLDMTDPVHIIEHNDIVTSVCPVGCATTGPMFATGGFDCLVRVCNAVTGRIESQCQTQDIITAVAFSPDGYHLLAGMRYGQCVVNTFSNNRFKFLTQIHCKNRKGPKSAGQKVTSIVFLDDAMFLISTNDSRLRLYSIDDFQLKIKYKGHKNTSGLIRASCSHNLMHIISGSETGRCFIWNKDIVYIPKMNPKLTCRKMNRNQCYEAFRPGSNTTVCIFAPLRAIRAVQERLLLDGESTIVSHAIIVATDGRIKVYFNQYYNLEC